MNSWENELVAALESKDESLVIRIIHQGFPVNIKLRIKSRSGKPVPGFTYALHEAIKHSLSETTKALLSYGASVYPINSYGNSPIILVSATGNLEILGILLRNKANLSSRDSYGNTILHVATQNKRVGFLKHCLNELKLPSVVKNKDGQTPLDIARDIQEHCTSLTEAETLQSIVELLWKAENLSRRGVTRKSYLRSLGPRIRDEGRFRRQTISVVPPDDKYLVSPVKPGRVLMTYLNEKRRAILRNGIPHSLPVRKSAVNSKPWSPFTKYGVSRSTNN